MGGSVAPETRWSGGRPAPFFARWRDPWQSADACDAPASSAADTPRPTTKMSASASMYVPFSSVQQDEGVAVHAPGRTPGTRGGGSRMGSAESDYCKTRPDECPHGTAAGRTGRQGQAAFPSPGRLRDSAAARLAHVWHWRVRSPACGDDGSMRAQSQRQMAWDLERGLTRAMVGQRTASCRSV